MMLLLDSYIIRLYMLTGSSLTDFFIGTFLLAIISVAIGELSVRILMRVNRSHMSKLDTELTLKHDQSIAAKRSGDEQSYKELNREANDAFGRVFFNMFTFSAASLWATFLSLAWMQLRFRGIEFPIPVKLPVFGESVGYIFIFFLLFVLARVILKNLKTHFSRQSEKLNPSKHRH